MMTKADVYMNENINNILENGYKDIDPRPHYEDGTPAHTISVNQVVRKYDLSKGEFPICTLRPVAWKTGIREIFTIYQKPTNIISEMEALNVTWWHSWNIGDGSIGQRYGATVKRYDLVNNLIKDIIENPYGRRKIMSLWQETDLRETEGLAPCAFLTAWNVRDKYLDMTLFQRSGDMLTASGAGMINEVQYTALLMMIARHTGYEPGVFCHFVQNEQIYDRHIEQAHEMLLRYKNKSIEESHSMRLNYHALPENLRDEIEYHNQIKEVSMPKLILNPEKKDFFEITIDDFTMINYEPVKPQLKLELGI